MYRRLFYFDPHLKGAQGHYEWYARQICNSVSELNIESFVFASMDYKISGRNYTKPLFDMDHHSINRDSRPYDYLSSCVISYYASVCRVINDYHVSPDDILFCPYVDTAMVMVMSRILTHYDAVPRTVLLFGWDTRYLAGHEGLPERSVEMLLGLAMSEMAYGKNGDKIRIFADSNDASEEYEVVTGVRCCTAPLPISQKLYFYVRGLKNNQPVIISLLGDVREEKGVRYIPGLIQSLNEYLLSDRVKLRLQISSHNGRVPDEIKPFASHYGVELIERAMTEEAYYECVCSSSVILLPYDVVAYARRTSGIFAEAVAASVPVVVPRGTWMERQLSKHGAGKSFDQNREGDFNKAVIDTIKNIYDLQRMAQDRNAEFISFHTPQRLARFICGVSA